jgi:hypothetical protein
MFWGTELLESLQRQNKAEINVIQQNQNPAHKTLLEERQKL